MTSGRTATPDRIAGANRAQLLQRDATWNEGSACSTAKNGNSGEPSIRCVPCLPERELIVVEVTAGFRHVKPYDAGRMRKLPGQLRRVDLVQDLAQRHEFVL